MSFKAYGIGHRPAGTSNVCLKEIWNIHVLDLHHDNNGWNTGNLYVAIMQTTDVVFTSYIEQKIKPLYTTLNDSHYKPTHMKHPP